MRAYYLIVIILLTQLTGCMGVVMKKSEDQTIPTLDQSKSRLVVMRSSLHGAVVPALMYEIIDEKPQFIAVLNNNEKIFVDTTPGQHTFMSLGVNVRFLIANMTAGKTYYAMASPRGWPGVNFNLNPFLHSGSTEFILESDKFKSWLDSTALMEITPEAIEWAKSREGLLNTRFPVEWPLWNEKPEDFKLQFTLAPGDGL